MPDSVKPKVKQPLKNTGANAASSSKAASSATSSGVAMAATGSTASDVAMAAVEGGGDRSSATWSREDSPVSG